MHPTADTVAFMYLRRAARRVMPGVRCFRLRGAMNKPVNVSFEDESKDRLRAFLSGCTSAQCVHLLTALIHWTAMYAQQSYPIYLSADGEAVDRRRVDIFEAERMVLLNEIQIITSRHLLEAVSRWQCTVGDLFVEHIFELAEKCKGQIILSHVINDALKSASESQR
jgi:hypothetical protein